MIDDYLTVSKVLKYLDDNFKKQPELEELAQQAGISPFYLQKVFTRWVGISPKKFLQYLTIDYAKKILSQSRSVLDAAYESGLSGPGRVHDLFVNIEAVTPGEYKNKGLGLCIYYAFHESPFGYALLAVTDRGLCGLSFHDKKNDKDILPYLKQKWQNAEFIEDDKKTKVYYDQIFSGNTIQPDTEINIFLKGSKFQIKVWEALLKIPVGHLFSYNDVAKMIGMTGSSRAVGNAIGANPISYLIPCHRVIKNMGIIGNYHWGSNRKKAIIGWEAVESRH